MVNKRIVSISNNFNDLMASKIIFNNFNAQNIKYQLLGLNSINNFEIFNSLKNFHEAKDANEINCFFERLKPEETILIFMDVDGYEKFRLTSASLVFQKNVFYHTKNLSLKDLSKQERKFFKNHHQEFGMHLFSSLCILESFNELKLNNVMQI